MRGNNHEEKFWTLFKHKVKSSKKKYGQEGKGGGGNSGFRRQLFVITRISFRGRKSVCTTNENF